MTICGFFFLIKFHQDSINRNIIFLCYPITNLVILPTFFSETRLTRKTPPSYADGVYMMAGQDRPSPRFLSEMFMKGTEGMGSTKNRTAMLAFFGKYFVCFFFFFFVA